MAIKLVALDLDDTLLDPDLRISAESIRTIQKARQMDVAITISTGRMYASALPYARQLGIDVPLITYQGALVKNSLSGEVLYFQPVPDQLAAEVMGICQHQGVHFHSYFDDHLVMESVSEEGKAYAQLAGVPITIVRDLVGHLKTNAALKIMAISTDAEQLLELERLLQAGYADQLHITRSKSHYLEVMSPVADKAKALEVVASHYKIERQEVMAIGDSYNDMEMIKWAGIGVAMGNSRQALKEAADYVTASNTEEGVAKALQRFILDVG